MLIAQVPTLLALLGTALMAVVIFAPAPAAPTVTASCAPPPAMPPFERWTTAPDPFGSLPVNDVESWPAAEADPAPFSHVEAPFEPDRRPAWPALLDSRAAGCGAPARLELVTALAAVRTPWSDDVLRCALAEESDRLVRDAIAAALATRYAGALA
jgi:hypothetical protein